MAVKCITIPIYDVHLYLVDDPADARKFVEEHSAEAQDLDSLLQCRGLCHEIVDTKGDVRRMLCVFDREDTASTAIHEAVHAAWMTLRHCGVRVRANTDEEPLAYLTAWIACEVVRLLPGKERLTPAMSLA